MVNFPRKMCVSIIEMMGFFLQYDLGVMENVFHSMGRRHWNLRLKSFL
jgi:hypothetical protein